MKLNNLHKIKKEFDPNRHWYQLIMIIIFILILISGYSVYNFLYIKNQIHDLKIEAEQNISNSTSTDFLEKTKKNNQLMKNINNLQRNLDKYEKRELEYNRLLNNRQITQSTTTVATSSKQ